jgi:hypothetical protein
MCKIKDQEQRTKENLNEYYDLFYSWLDELELLELSEKDINKIEEDSKEPSTVCKLILSDLALNNFDFNPKLGA